MNANVSFAKLLQVLIKYDHVIENPETQRKCPIIISFESKICNDYIKETCDLNGQI